MSQSIEMLDLTGVACPTNSARVLLKLAQVPNGALLEVLLDEGEPIENVPASIEDEGHRIIARVRKAKQWKLTVQKSY